MKALLYVIAIAAIGAGAWFSYQTMETFTKLKSDREELAENNERRKVSIKKKEDEAVDMEAQQTAARKKRVQTEADLDTAKSNVSLAKREAATWKNKIAEQKEKLENNQNLIDEIKKAFKDELGDNVDLGQIPGLVKQLEDDVKKANKKLEELTTYREAAEKRVANNSSRIQELGKREAKRAANMRANALSGTVTAVNHDWGFALIRIPSGMPVTDVSELIVKRGNTYVGRLDVNAVEGTRIVTDVDYKSMSRGLVVQPGDSVILAKPVTR